MNAAINAGAAATAAGGVRAVLFDLDGTLIDTWALYLEAYRATLLPRYGRPVTVADIRALEPVSEYSVLANAVGAERAPAWHAAFVGHYARLHDAHSEGLYPGVAGMLAALRAAGPALGLVTGKSRAAWEITAARTALPPFDVVVTEDDVAAPKPDPDGLRRALAALAVRPAEAVYVGDSVVDLAAARAAGVAPLAVLWCKAPHEREPFVAAAREHGALACLETPGELPAVLGHAPAVAAG